MTAPDAAAPSLVDALRKIYGLKAELSYEQSFWLSEAAAGLLALDYRFAASLARYTLHGVPTGDFLRQVLANDLAGAMRHGDELAVLSLKALTRFVYLHLPAAALGSDGDVRAWIARSGLAGPAATAPAVQVLA